jgi:predicted acyltransferase
MAAGVPPPEIEPLAAWTPPAPERRERAGDDAAPAARLESLDVFRGATVAAMIFVNNPGDWGHLYAPFGHAAWHGWTVTDLIFPFFLFIVGVAGVLSLRKRTAQGASRPALYRHVLVRGLTIVLVGWALAWFPFTLERLSHLRIPGVLPRIGLVFALGTCLVLAAGKRVAPVVAGAVAALLLLHTWLLVGTGFDLSREGNVQRAVDLALLKGHLWKKDWDPEGIVSTLTATATMLTGTLAGLVLTGARERRGRIVTALLLGGLACVAAGQVWSHTLPINKNLWTGSYVLLSSGLAAAALALSILLVDVMGVRRPFAFFLPFGRNPLLAFVLSGLLAKVLGLVKLPVPAGKASLHAVLYSKGFSFIPEPTLRSHAFALTIVLLGWAVLKACDRRGWYWKV